MIFAIDPGTTESAYVVLAGGLPVKHGKVPNEEVPQLLNNAATQQGMRVVCEMIACYGMPAGAELFQTCVWIGEFRHVCRTVGLQWDVLTRVQVKERLCHRVSKITDSVIRQRLIDMYGGKTMAIGNKLTPGPLYGIKADAWAALAVAKAWEAA